MCFQVCPEKCPPFERLGMHSLAVCRKDTAIDDHRRCSELIHRLSDELLDEFLFVWEVSEFMRGAGLGCL